MHRNTPHELKLPDVDVARRLVEVLLKTSDGRQAIDASSWFRFYKQLTGKSAPPLDQFLAPYSHLFQCEVRFTDATSCSGSVTYDVRLNVALQLCPDHCSQDGCDDTRCRRLHCCKFHLLGGNCRHPNNCRYGHDLASSHNSPLVQRHLVDGLSPPQIGQLIRWSDGATELTVPKICKFYNNEGECGHADGIGCSALHVCRHFITGDCKFGSRCKRSHNVYDNQPKFILQKFGMDVRRSQQDCLAELRKTMQVRGNPNGPPNSSPASAVRSAVGGNVSQNNGHRETPAPAPKICKFYNNADGCHHGFAGNGCNAMHVCRYFVLNACKFGDRCKRSHNIYDSQPKALISKAGIDVTGEPAECLAELRRAVQGSAAGGAAVASGGAHISSPFVDLVSAAAPANSACSDAWYKTEIGTAARPRFPDNQLTDLNQETMESWHRTTVSHEQRDDSLDEYCSGDRAVSGAKYVDGLNAESYDDDAASSAESDWSDRSGRSSPFHALHNSSSSKYHI